MTPPAPRETASRNSRPIARSATPCRCGSASGFRGPARRAGECEMNDNGGAAEHPRRGEEGVRIGSGAIRTGYRSGMLGRPKVVLAPGSPRRVGLLNQAGTEPEARRPADVDETPRRGELPRACANRLARAKADAALKSV